MAKINIILDTRTTTKKGEHPLKISIASGNGLHVYHSLGLFLPAHEWDKVNQKAIGRNNYALNTELDTILYEWRQVAKDLPLYNMKAIDIKNAILAKLQPQKSKNGTFFSSFETFIAKKEGRTKQMYCETLHRIEQHEPKIKSYRLEDITLEWLEKFDKYLALTAPSPNSRSIHLRNIRAVFNHAIDNDITTYYPFRKFKIKTQETAKRSLTVDELRFIFNYTAEPHAQKYIDVFKLIFLLIGINIVDLCALKKIINGKIEYHRAKTNKLYIIKVEKETKQLLNQFTDNEGNIDIARNYANHKDFAKKVNTALQRIGLVTRSGRGGKKTYRPLFPGLTTYWARHSWATIAAELDIPNETIAAALGHSYGNRTTAIYINFNQKKIDEANRRVIDFVLYNKR